MKYKHNQIKLLFICVLTLFSGKTISAQQTGSLSKDSVFQFFKTEFVLEARVTVGTMILVGETVS